MNTTTRDRQEIVDELGEIQSQILELVEQARALLRNNEYQGALARAESYWIAHVTTAISNNHGYLCGSTVSLQDTIDEIKDAKDDED
jgi:hypothetical protein